MPTKETQKESPETGVTLAHHLVNSQLPRPGVRKWNSLLLKID